MEDLNFNLVFAGDYISLASAAVVSLLTFRSGFLIALFMMYPSSVRRGWSGVRPNALSNADR